MARDLIMFNNIESLITIKSIQSILIREMLLIDYETKLEPILAHFNNDNSHMGVITQVVSEEGKDPVYDKIGIITREDIVEEMIMEEI
jgi:Mg2+/Co2+ transporter CorB